VVCHSTGQTGEAVQQAPQVAEETAEATLAEQVHNIRTDTRRVEATLHALLRDRKRRGPQA
jgi:hypothetical protein